MLIDDRHTSLAHDLELSDQGHPCRRIRERKRIRADVETRGFEVLRLAARAVEPEGGADQFELRR